MFLPLRLFSLGDDVNDSSFSLSLSRSLPLSLCDVAHVATRAGFNARASARIGGATRACKQDGVAQFTSSVPDTNMEVAPSLK